MITERSLFILGAGASRPYLFPTGVELTNLILERNESIELLINMGFTKDTFVHLNTTYPQSDNNPYIQYHLWLEDGLSDLGVSKKDLETLQKQFRESQLYSIDSFVARNQSYKPLASLIVAFILLRCEQRKALYGDWYQFLFNELVATRDDFDSNYLAVITFNYDRSLELYLFNAFKNTFSLKTTEAWKRVARINILHVYGDLGHLPYSGASDPIDYGDCSEAEKAAQGIQLVEPRIMSNRTDEIRSMINFAGKIVFLGFGFDPMNMDVLDLRPTPKPVFASCFNLSIPTIRRATERLQMQHIPSNRFVVWGDRSHKISDFLNNSEAFT